MKKIIIALFLLLVYNDIHVMAQSKKTQVCEIYEHVEQMPVYSGGENELMQCVMKSIKYPLDTEGEKISGSVVVQFIVKENGELSQLKVVRSIYPALDNEILQAIKNLPGRWLPGKEKGKVVPVLYNLPIVFQYRQDLSSHPFTKLRVNETIKAPLQGSWQLCTRVDSLGSGAYKVQTGPYLKFLLPDETFFGMYVAVSGRKSIITAKGIYHQTSDSTYIERKQIIKSGQPQKELELKFGFLREDLMLISYRRPGYSTRIREVWIRVMPPNSVQLKNN